MSASSAALFIVLACFGLAALVCLGATGLGYTIQQSQNVIFVAFWIPCLAGIPIFDRVVKKA
jgi:hypothetical protein